MNTDPDSYTQPTVRHAVPNPVPTPGGDTTPLSTDDTTTSSPQDEPDTDPLAKITLRPRGFAVIMAVVGMLLGMILALVPVRVASPDAADPARISCGNTIGGVETDLLAEGLGDVGQSVMATYVGTCDAAINFRLVLSWPLFFAGAICMVWLGTVRREQPTTPAPSEPSGP